MILTELTWDTEQKMLNLAPYPYPTMFHNWLVLCRHIRLLDLTPTYYCAASWGRQATCALCTKHNPVRRTRQLRKYSGQKQKAMAQMTQLITQVFYAYLFHDIFLTPLANVLRSSKDDDVTMFSSMDMIGSSISSS